LMCQNLDTLDIFISFLPIERSGLWYIARICWCVIWAKNYSRMILLNSEKQCLEGGGWWEGGREGGGGGLFGCNYD
jgi:hypothetical protein